MGCLCAFSHKLVFPILHINHHYCEMLEPNIKMRPEGEKPLSILIKEKDVYHTACECGDSNAGGPGCISPS
jgi:hypothetical protein